MSLNNSPYITHYIIPRMPNRYPYSYNIRSSSAKPQQACRLRRFRTNSDGQEYPWMRHQGLWFGVWGSGLGRLVFRISGIGFRVFFLVKGGVRLWGGDISACGDAWGYMGICRDWYGSCDPSCTTLSLLTHRLQWFRGIKSCKVSSIDSRNGMDMWR